jgi:hypothetical protein
MRSFVNILHVVGIRIFEVIAGKGNVAVVCGSAQIKGKFGHVI